MKSKIIPIARLLVTISIGCTCIYSLMGCGSTSSNRQTEQIQSEANAEAEKNQLQPAIGRFEGQVMVAATHHKYDAVLQTKIIYKVLPSPTDPTINISVPKLGGFLSFPILNDSNLNSSADYSEITNPLGGIILAAFDGGDYDPHSSHLNLPYKVSQYGSGTFGSFQGDLNNEEFVGEWHSRVQSLVGTFDLVRVASP